MKLSVSKQEIQTKLSGIQNIVERRNTMPVLSHFLIEAGPKGASIVATDLETAIREPMDISVEKPGRLCIPARKLFEIVKEVDGDVSLSSDDNQWITVSAGASSFRLACLGPEEFPSWPELGDAAVFEVDGPTLGTMLEKTIYASGESDTRYTLNGVLFHISGGALTIVGTDGHRMALIKKTLGGNGGAAGAQEKSVIVPRKAASELRRFLDDEGPVSVSVGSNNILFKVKDVQFLARLIEGTYPNYSQVIPAKNEKRMTVGRDGFVKSLRRVSVMSRERSNAVRVDISEGSLVLSSSNPDLGEAKDEIKVDYSGEAVAIGYNARFLLEALNAISTDGVVMEFQDALSPTLLKDEGSEDYKCVVMPMRI